MDTSKWPARAVSPIAPPGFIFIIITILISGVFFYLGWRFPGWIAVAAAIFVIWFFRDPNRLTPADEKALIAPADGRIIIAGEEESCPYLDGPCTKVSIFMNVFNVHVNRIPHDGVVERVIYHPGKFINASLDKASVYNERNALIIRTVDGTRFAVVQVAGLIARRIVNHAGEGDRVEKGVRYGMIRFGSRLDLYLPSGFDVRVGKGDRTRAGATIIGYMP